VVNITFLKDLVVGGKNGEVTTTRTPGWVIGGDGFFGEFLAWWLCC
jgi:hypothetical protein